MKTETLNLYPTATEVISTEQFLKLGPQDRAKIARVRPIPTVFDPRQPYQPGRIEVTWDSRVYRAARHAKGKRNA